jgi:hypothetical protein
MEFPHEKYFLIVRIPPESSSPIKPILFFQDIRLHNRRNDISTDNNSIDSHSIMSADSIEPNEHNEILKKSKTLNQYTPIKNFINKWNTPKTPLLDTNDTELKDLLSVSSATNKKQERLVNENLNLI